MKSIFFHISLTLTLLFALISCGEMHHGKSLEDMPDATQGDSLLYYYGQVQAANYWREAESDTSMNSPKAREEYLRGLHTALKLIGENKHFNAGVLAGVELGIKIRSFVSNYDVQLHPEVLYQSISYGMESAPNAGDDTFSEDYYHLLARIQSSTAKADKEKADKALKAAARRMNMIPVNTSLYQRVDKQGGKQRLLQDMAIEARITFSCNGSTIPVPIPAEVKVGAYYNNPVLNQALFAMNEGEECTFLTTAVALFGNRTLQMHLDPEDIVTIHIQLGKTTNSVADISQNADGSTEGVDAL